MGDVGNIHTMGKSFARQLIIQQRGNNAQFRQAEPQGHIFNTVAGKDGHTIALRELFFFGPSRNAVGIGFHVIIGPLLLTFDKGDILAIGIDPHFKLISDEAV